MELLKNLEGMSADEQMTAVVELQKAAMKTLEEQKQASIGKSAELVIQGLKKIKSDFEAKFDSLNYDIQTKVASLKDGEQGLQGPKGEQGDRGLDGSNGRDGRDGKDGKDGLDGVDGVGVRDAKIDFDGSLVISLTDGREINCGEVVSVDVAKQIQKVTHNIQTGSGGDSQTVLDAIAALQATIATYGTMATQNANNVAITGGTINNTTIGATTPSTGVFTTLTSNSTSEFGKGSAQYIRAVGDATAPVLSAQGSGTNIDFNVTTKGYGSFKINDAGGTIAEFNDGGSGTPVNSFLFAAGGASGTRALIRAMGGPITLLSTGSNSVNFATNGASGNIQALVSHTASAVNYVQVTGAATGGSPSITFTGSDANVNGVITTKGTGILYLQSAGLGTVRLGNSGGEHLHVSGAASSVNRFALKGTTAGSTPLFWTSGTDTNIGMDLSTKGSGVFRFYTNDQNGGTGAQQLQVAHTASAVNYVQVTGAATGSFPTVSAQGSDANLSFFINAKGNGAVNVSAHRTNYLQLAGAGATFAPVISAIGSDTNIPLVLQPKGTGALQAQQTDSTATGGNARGANAVDWQTLRSTNTMVASGQVSFIGGGQNNTSSSYGTVVCGGANSYATGANTFVGSGNANIASGPYSSVISGSSNSATGYFNFIGSGISNSGTANAVVTTQSGTMNGTTAVTLSGSNASIKVGQYITGTSIAFNTYVAAISGTSLTLSQAASGSSTSTLSFYTPHGVVVGGGNNQATGSYSFIGGGGDAGTAANRNVASGDWSVVVGGQKNAASAIYSFVGGGGGNTASQTGSVVCGGGAYGGNPSSFLSNTSAGLSSFIGAGLGNSTDSSYSAVIAGVYGRTRGIQCNHVFAASNNPMGSFQAGQAQAALVVLGKQTTDATATTLTIDGNAGATTNQVILPNNSAYYFKGSVIANVTGGGNTKAWAIEGAIKRGANAASTALVGTPTVTSAYADVGAATWAITATADTTNGGLAITFTGQAGTTIRVVCKVETTEVTF